MYEILQLIYIMITLGRVKLSAVTDNRSLIPGGVGNFSSPLFSGWDLNPDNFLFKPFPRHFPLQYSRLSVKLIFLTI
jgi:hypothetical protein